MEPDPTKKFTYCFSQKARLQLRNADGSCSPISYLRNMRRCHVLHVSPVQVPEERMPEKSSGKTYRQLKKVYPGSDKFTTLNKCKKAVLQILIYFYADPGSKKCPYGSGCGS